ncbi:flavodoxin [Paenibacillus taiwanensis]|uniref:flavodoxin n=1 Tax=Paenibacillus taiwanensis TaxID=401638 RepID=UPI0003FC7E93|nr:flavodoxin [Paenibacillus taiwanensis]
MSNIIMIFASMTGNTEDIAKAVERGIRSTEAELTVKEVMDAETSELANYDGIVLGAYTWGDGELPDEFLDFYDDMDELSLSGKKAIVFGSCDSSYHAYGAAVDLLIEKLQSIGCEVVLEGLKIELSPSKDEEEQCAQFGRDFVAKL